MRPGVRVAVDVGSVRIGVARSDPGGLLAVPLDSVPAGPDAIATVAAVLDEWQAIDAYVGLPLQMDGREGSAASAARRWAGELAERTLVPVRLIDERLSTVQAQRGLHASGRSSRSSRPVIDSASAVVVLQSVLDREQTGGTPPGTVIEPSSGEEAEHG